MVRLEANCSTIRRNAIERGKCRECKAAVRHSFMHDARSKPRHKRQGTKTPSPTLQQQPAKLSTALLHAYCRQRFGTPNYGLKPCVARLAPDLRNLPRFFDLVPNTTLLHQPWLLPNPCRSLKASSREPIRHPEQPTSTTNASSSALYIFVLQVPCPPLVPSVVVR